MMKKSQTSVEVAVIIGILLIIFAIFLSINIDMQGIFSSRYSQDRIRLALDDISSAADLVYTQGNGSKSEVFISLPSNIINSTISDNTLTFHTYPAAGNADSHQVYRTMDFPVSGTLPNSSGNYIVVVESLGGSVNVSYS